MSEWVIFLSAPFTLCTCIKLVIQLVWRIDSHVSRFKTGIEAWYYFRFGTIKVHEHTFFSSTIKTTILMKIQKTYNEGENNSSRASAFCCGHLTAHFPHWHIKCYDKHKLVYGSSHCNHAILAHPSQLKCSLQTYSRDHNKFPKRQQEFYQYGTVGGGTHQSDPAQSGPIGLEVPFNEQFTNCWLLINTQTKEN